MVLPPPHRQRNPPRCQHKRHPPHSAADRYMRRAREAGAAQLPTKAKVNASPKAGNKHWRKATAA
jgi:hypothetical protein